MSGWRKKGLLDKVFIAYGPEDYQMVVEEWTVRKGLSDREGDE